MTIPAENQTHGDDWGIAYVISHTPVLRAVDIRHNWQSYIERLHTIAHAHSPSQSRPLSTLR